MKTNMQDQANRDCELFVLFMAKITTFNPRVFLVSPRAGFGRSQFRPFFIQGMK
jgi:hypothetical protein